MTTHLQTRIFSCQIEQLRVEAIRRVDQLHGLPPQYLKTIEWNLRKDIQEVEKVGSVRVDSPHVSVIFIFQLTSITMRRLEIGVYLLQLEP